MTGVRPEQAVLSRDTDLSQTDETRRVIEGMVDGLNDHRIDDIGAFFAESFRWMITACCVGCGTVCYVGLCTVGVRGMLQLMSHCMLRGLMH